MNLKHTVSGKQNIYSIAVHTNIINNTGYTNTVNICTQNVRAEQGQCIASLLSTTTAPLTSCTSTMKSCTEQRVNRLKIIIAL